jgi:hypothetical protein
MQYATDRKVKGSISDVALEFFCFHLPKPFNRNIALGSTQALTGIITRIIPWDEGWSVNKAGNLTAISEAIL